MVEIFLAFFKAIPALRDIVLEAVHQWNILQIGAFDAEAKKIKEELDFTTKQMQGATTDEERIIIHRIRARLLNFKRMQ